jgi:hemoglobin
LEHYRTSPEFTATTVPKSLLIAHRTKAGTWGLLRVAQGRLRYCVDAAPPQALVIEQGGTAVIDPEALHHVEVLDAKTRFLVEFHRRTGTA